MQDLYAQTVRLSSLRWLSNCSDWAHAQTRQSTLHSCADFSLVPELGRFDTDVRSRLCLKKRFSS
jgi:hypothetical protein